MQRLSELAHQAALSALGLHSQDARLLRIDFPHGDGPPDTVLLVNRLAAREQLSRDFQFDVELLSDDAGIALTALLGRMVTISLVRNDGSPRYFNGYVTAFSRLRTDGGFAFYTMLLEPWLAFARLRQDSVSFLDQSVLDLTDTTLARYRQHAYRTSLSGDYPPLSCANQYNETDYNHLHRRWEAHGIYYWYEHAFDGHTLWLADDSTLAAPLDATGDDEAGVMLFRAASGAAEADGVRNWQPLRRAGPDCVTVASFDYKQPGARRATGHARSVQGAVPPHEWFEDGGLYAYQDQDGGERLAQRRIEERDLATQVIQAGGNHRAAQPGRLFRLDGQADAGIAGDDSGRNYLIVSVEHSASNNYHAGPQGASHYDNTFACIDSTVRWRPGRDHNSAPTTLMGIQTAIVTGPPGADLHTDEVSRIKLQFHWDRVGQYDQASSPWIRVMMPMAGRQLGQAGLPRVGQEVVVQFVNGNLDHPLVIGVVHNGANPPPFDLPGQQALSGLRSKELQGQRANHLLLDDTAGQIQAQLKSDHQCSQLSLGHIVRIDDHTGRQDQRGEGWELATDAWGVARAARGLLLTTEGRPGAASHIKSMDETLQRLRDGADRQQMLATQAMQAGAQDSAQQQCAVAGAIDTQSRQIHGAGAGFPELAAPHLVLASAAGIATTSAQSTQIASAEHTALTTGRSLSIAAGDGLFASIGNAFRLFVRQAGMRLVAAAGKVTISAQSDDIELIADKVLHLISQSDWVDIRGRKGIRLHGGDCRIEISDKVEFFTPVPTLFHGNLETLAPQSQPQPAPPPPVAPAAGQLHHTLQASSGGAKRLANVPYTLYQGNSKIEDGITDENGRIVIEHQDGTQQYRVVLGGGEEFLLAVSPRLTQQQDASGQEQLLSNQGWRALDDSANGRQHQ